MSKRYPHNGPDPFAPTIYPRSIAPRFMRCDDCGRKLTPCPARWDGEPTTVGYYACSCEEARSFDAELDEMNESLTDTGD